jgi:GntR family transcriptional regulator / MocR family aminotransferase
MTFHISLVGRKNLSTEIYRQLRDGILNGLLRPGEPLPATRELAGTLSVSRMTVTVAYDRLISEGFAYSRVGAGTFVSEHAIRLREGTTQGGISPLRPRAIWDPIELPSGLVRPATFDFRTGIPDASLFPHRTWRRLIARSLRAEVIAKPIYGDPAGHPRLREAIARHIGISRGVVASPDEVTVTNGTQQALDVIARVLLAPGDRIAVEDPGYRPPRRLFASLGARIVGVSVDHEGVIVKKVPSSVRAVYVTPSHQFPLGVAMTLPRRQALLQWAERNDAAIIEDDYDSEFRFKGRPLDPLRTIDTAGRVIYIGSFSKTMLPSLRLGFIIAPPSLRSAIHKAKFVSDWHTPSLAQIALASFIDDGGFIRHIRRVSKVYRKRHEILTEIVSTDFSKYLELIPSSTGLHVSALAREASVEEIAQIAMRAAKAGVAIQILSWFAAVNRTQRAGVVLGYGGIATEQIREGLRRLRRCFSN